MCLSNVYRSELSDNNLMFKNIADLKLDGDTITMTNILGIPTSVRGTVKKIDLLENADLSRLLTLRYVQEARWDEIMAELGYCESHIFRLHRQAILLLDRALKDESK